MESHPEVGVCCRCVGTLTKRRRQIERRTRHAPSGPLGRRIAYRLLSCAGVYLIAGLLTPRDAARQV
ncbi:MAG TPA: hypothetical protein VFP03_05325 [Jiangellaceae bacterium]|nr:hypothetical protein [Jiangellaceae bacterium]